MIAVIYIIKLPAVNSTLEVTGNKDKTEPNLACKRFCTKATWRPNDTRKCCMDKRFPLIQRGKNGRKCEATQGNQHLRCAKIKGTATEQSKSQTQWELKFRFNKTILSVIWMLFELYWFFRYVYISCVNCILKLNNREKHEEFIPFFRLDI